MCVCVQEHVHVCVYGLGCCMLIPQRLCGGPKTTFFLFQSPSS